MNTAKTKLIAWSVAGLLGAGLCLYVGTFLVAFRSHLKNSVTTDQMRRVLDNTPEIIAQAEDIVPYDRVEAALIKANWTGVEPKKAVDTTPKPVVPETSKEGVEALVKIHGFKADTRVAEGGLVVLQYLSASQVPQNRNARNKSMVTVGVGSRLAKPIDHITIVGIDERGVEFGFDDEEREHEFLQPGDLTLGGRIVTVDPDQVRVREVDVFQRAANYSTSPKETMQLSPTRFRVGTEDSVVIADDYSRILSEDVRLGRHRDPVSGRWDGIEVETVRPNSIAARHGVKTGDVIKSINGHPVTSTQEAISFVKNNQDAFDRWEVVVSNMGQQRTVVYLPPIQE